MSDLIESISCPVDDCDWSTDLTPPPQSWNDSFASALRPSLTAVVAQSRYLDEAERQLREHFRVHFEVQYLRTIIRLRGEIEHKDDLIAELRKQLEGALNELAGGKCR